MTQFPTKIVFLSLFCEFFFKKEEEVFQVKRDGTAGDKEHKNLHQIRRRDAPSGTSIMPIICRHLT